MRARLAPACAVALVLGASAWIAASASALGDYPRDAGPAIRALAAGDVGRFFDLQPLMGSFSLLLRAPFAALAGSGASDLTLYRLGAFPCIAAAGLLGLALARELRGRGGSPLAQALVTAACVTTPLTFAALEWGHPEELLGASLAIGAVIAALRGHGAAAIVLLGLALGTKQWAVIAVGPVLLAWPGSRARLAAGAGALAGLLTVPLAILGPDAFSNIARQTAQAKGVTSAVSVWWPLASAERRTIGGGESFTYYDLPDWVAGVSRPLIVLLPLALALVLWRRRPEGLGGDVLALLALGFLLRCLLEPVNNEYYHVPFLLSLAAWDAHRRRGLPLTALLAAGALWLTFARVAHLHDPALTNAFYLGWTVPLAAYLAAVLYAPTLVSSFGKRLRISQPVSVTTTRSSIRTPNAPAR
jgi:hypothetical protein